MILRDPRLEYLLEPFSLQNAADIASNILRELFGIGHDHDLCRRPMGELPSRQANGKKQGLQVPRWKIDDEPPCRAVDKRHQFSGEIFQIPVMFELCSIQFADGLAGEGKEVIAQY